MPKGIYIKTEDHKRNLSLAGMNRIVSIETRLKLSKIHTGRIFTEERKNNISKALKGRVLTKSWRNKISKAHKNKPLTEDHKKKIGRSGESSATWKGGISKNKDHVRRRMREWYKKNPLKFKAYGHNRRTLERSLSPNVVESIYTDNINKFGALTCYLCLKKIIVGSGCLEHKTPLSRGGTNEYSNLEISCISCNSKKGRKTLEEYKIKCV